MPVLSIDGSAEPDSAPFKWADLLKQSAQMGGCYPRANGKFKQHLKE